LADTFEYYLVLAVVIPHFLRLRVNSRLYSAGHCLACALGAAFQPLFCRRNRLHLNDIAWFNRGQFDKHWVLNCVLTTYKTRFQFMMAAATAYHLPRPTSGPSTLYPRGGLADLDFKDTRYPMLGASSTNNRRGSAVPNGLHDLSGWDNTNEAARKDNSDRPGLNGRSETDTKEREEESGSQEQSQPGIINGMAPGVQQAQPSKLESVVQYALPTDTTRRVVERYSMDENRDDILSPESDRPFLQDSPLQDSPQDESITASQHQQGIGRAISPERPISILPASPRHPSLLPAPGAGPSNRESTYTPVGPSSASPLYNSTAVAGLAAVPLSSNPRAYAHQPTYVTPSSAPNPLQPVYLPNPPPLQEEVCVECAMRDQDMADVDVTGPGVWERESDALYDDLVRREQEEEQEDVISNESYKSNRPRAKGGRLSESNLKVWLTMVSAMLIY
jgi:hypothetical protein